MNPVVIVGAGLAGLSCARALKRRHVPFLIIEGDGRIGGKLKTDRVDSFYLDRGYKVYFTAYPVAREQLDEHKLNLQRFVDGAYVIWNGDQYLINRDKPLQFAASGFLSMGDKLRLAKWTSDVQWLDQADIEEMPDRSIEQYLRDEGFSDEFLDRFMRPFVGAMFLDRSLSTSCRHFAFVWKALVEGDITIPKFGMEEIPKELGATFQDDVLMLGTRVAEVLRDAGGAATGVRLEDGQEIEASKVVLACDSDTASRLSGIPFDIEHRHSITLYFATASPPLDPGWLVLNGNMKGITNHAAVIPHIGMEIGACVVCATILGQRPESDGELAEIVRSEMRTWFPRHDLSGWRFLRCYRSNNAQMVQLPGFEEHLPKNDSGVPNLYFAGEYTTNSSINGAIRSGLECADLLLSRMEAGIA